MQLDYMERVIQALQEVDSEQRSTDVFCLLPKNMHVSCRGRMLFWKALPAQAKHCVSCVQRLLGVRRRGRQVNTFYAVSAATPSHLYFDSD